MARPEGFFGPKVVFFEKGVAHSGEKSNLAQLKMGILK
jgi:hypothetical protein